MGRRRGFSLVELLVVIGIIAILVAMLMPTLSKAREQAVTLQCQAQLREIGHALQLYANNNRGYMPGWSGWHAYPDGAGDDDPGLGWMEKTARYCTTPDRPLWSCPAFRPGFPMNYFIGVRWVAVQNPQRFHLKFSDLRTSSQFVLSGDCTQPMLYPPFLGAAPHVSDDCDKDDAVNPGIVFFGEPGGWNVHRSGNNVLFGDGHVGCFRKFDPSAMTYSAHGMQAWGEVTAE